MTPQLSVIQQYDRYPRKQSSPYRAFLCLLSFFLLPPKTVRYVKADTWFCRVGHVSLCNGQWPEAVVIAGHRAEEPSPCSGHTDAPAARASLLFWDHQQHPKWEKGSSGLPRHVVFTLILWLFRFLSRLASLL